MLNIFLGIIKTIILLGVLVVLHEGGHFTIAKLCKVKVNEFAIGFGKALWSKQGKETKYSIRMLPLGGYVSLEGEEEYSESENSFSKAGLLKKSLIIVAGALVNILFGIIVYYLLVVYHFGFNIANSSLLHFLKNIFESIKIIFTGGTSINDLSGPVGIATIVTQTSSLTDYIYLMAIISLSIGITNLIPIPPLDRWKAVNLYN